MSTYWDVRHGLERGVIPKDWEPVAESMAIEYVAQAKDAFMVREDRKAEFDAIPLEERIRLYERDPSFYCMPERDEFAREAYRMGFLEAQELLGCIGDYRWEENQ